MLDEAESFSMAHTNRFGGRRSTLADFAKGAVLADPRRDDLSISSATSSTTLSSALREKAKKKGEGLAAGVGQGRGRRASSSISSPAIECSSRK